MNLTYKRNRGLHWWECTRCGATWPARIPDQAHIETETRPRVWARPQTVKALGADGHTRPVQLMVPVGKGTETVVVDGYHHNPGAPELAVCPNCILPGKDGHFPTIRLVSRTPRRWSPNDHVDGSDPSPDGHPSTGGSASSPHRSGHRLDGEWGQWATIAARFARRGPFEDRDDLRHTIILRLAEIKARRGKALTEGAVVRIARFTVLAYWRDRGRQPTILSLDAPARDADGDETDYGDTLADDHAIDLDKWQDDRTWLLGCPKRLVVIAHKKVNGIPLTNADKCYLKRFRRKLAQKSLF